MSCHLAYISHHIKMIFSTQISNIWKLRLLPLKYFSWKIPLEKPTEQNEHDWAAGLRIVATLCCTLDQVFLCLGARLLQPNIPLVCACHLLRLGTWRHPKHRFHPQNIPNSTKNIDSSFKHNIYQVYFILTLKSWKTTCRNKFCHLNSFETIFKIIPPKLFEIQIKLVKKSQEVDLIDYHLR